MTPDPPARLLAGQIGKPHGLDGEVYVLPISDDPLRFEPGSVLLDPDDRELAVVEARRHRDRLLVRFEGVVDREGAEGLRGVTLFVTPADLRSLEADEFWPHYLIGSEVRTPDGAVVGRAVEVVPGAAQDLLQVETKTGPKLIPMTKAIVVEIDAAAGRITIDPPQGLLD
ncbi:MAG: ribosome maturation factor RimM [Actinomycetota bacterium]|nr:ribosome maturation factor RimM [Actinomycetota bacterium]